MKSKEVKCVEFDRICRIDDSDWNCVVVGRAHRFVNLEL